MPRLTVNGADPYYEKHGSGPETIVFAHGHLFSGHMFDAQVAARQSRYCCVTFDFRGQGQSGVIRDGYAMGALAEDAAALLSAVGAAPCHFAGLSMGGFVGMRLAARIPGAKLVTISDAGHSPPIEQPQAVTAAIAGFLDSLPRGQ